ncbi:hypothetical protein, partial [Flavobacterium psychrophilum]|uniref:hypothetical protein n=5 Tax=Flavobacterium psychrophilum TaxID=96345 RepID=UPI001ABBFA6C
KNIQFVIPRNEESHQVIQIMRFLVPRNDNILNKYSSIFKAKLVLDVGIKQKNIRFRSSCIKFDS